MACILITGCGSGLGLATAVRLAQDGHTVVAGVRALSNAEELIEALAHFPDSRVVALDVTDQEATDVAVAEALSLTGQIDVLVNNAAVAITGAVENATDDEVRHVFETNVFGLLRVTRAVLPGMRARSNGLIVNVSSIAGLWSLPFRSIYGASKHAVEALSDGLHLELQPFGIRVIVIEPGALATSLSSKSHQTGQGVDDLYDRTEKHFFSQVGRLHGVLDLSRDTAPVADAILRAVDDPSASRRILVGRDAQVFAALRGRADDAEFDAAIQQLIAGDVGGIGGERDR